jgi:pimeloyl-ACP methyl ester carboxylesterase
MLTAATNTQRHFLMNRMLHKTKHIDISAVRHLYPFESHFIKIKGLNYHFLDQGSGAPVVMLHGNPTWSCFFRELIKGLSKKFRTIVPDHMGCGLSDKPGIDRYDYRLKSRVDDVETLLDELGINQGITLVLHDWGGMIGMAYAVKHPERIRRLVVMNTAAFIIPDGKPLPIRLRLIRNIKPFAALTVLGFNVFAVGALFMASYKGLSRDVKSGLIAPYNSWHNRIATLKFVQDIPVRKKDPSYGLAKYVDDNLHQLNRLPMLLLWGEHDFVFDMDFLSEWRRRFPDATVRTFKDAGHYVLEDAADRIVPIVKNFLQQG